MIYNANLSEQLLHDIKKLEKDSSELLEMVCRKKEGQRAFIQEMIEMFLKMEPQLEQLINEEPRLTAHLMCKNVQFSLTNIMELIETDAHKARHKIKYELSPLIQELYVDLYFWGFCYPDQNKMKQYYRTEMPRLCPIPYTAQEGSSIDYKYDVSVVVVAYNKLEYTKLCLKYLKMYFPADLNHELILINNGSRDRTKEFFESLDPDKQVDIHINTKSFSMLSRIVEGKYILFISNDILIMPNAVQNMLTCIQSDDSIGCVVPTCPNTSNNQLIPVNYANEDEMITFAEKNNKSDPFRWEQRVRLIPPVVLARSSTEGIHAFFGFRYPFYSERFLAFTDDLMSMIMRRNGYKSILAKDAYVHHFGSITIAEEANAREEFYLNGRSAYHSAFGFDPWDKTCCFDPILINALSFVLEGPANILGINCGMGSNPLKVKEQLAENTRRRDVVMYNITNEHEFKQDLKGISDHFYFLEKWNEIEDIFENTSFSYIVAEDIDQLEDNYKVIQWLNLRLLPKGIMAIRSEDSVFKSTIMSLFDSCKQVGSWIIVNKRY